MVLITQVSIPEQKVSIDGTRFPCVFAPSCSGHGKDELVQAIGKQKQLINRSLLESGAILFRGFNLTSARDFEQVVDAFEYEPHEFSGGAWLVASGPKVTEVNVPASLPLDYHNEGAYLRNPPSKMMLFCEVAPPTGQGATTLLQGHTLYERMMELEPEFVHDLAQKKLVYSRALTESGWKNMFNSNNKDEVEERVEAMDSSIQWLEDGGAIWVSNPRNGVKKDESRGEREVWFNSIASMIQTTSTLGSLPPTFADGSPLPEQVIRTCGMLMKQEEVAIEWKKGDMLLIDNTAVMHSKQACNAERTILLSLCA